MKKLLKAIFNRLFHYLQKFGINILPNHFYSNVPDITFLRNNNFWKEPMEMIGVKGIDLKNQIAFTKILVSSLEDKSILQRQNIFKQAISEEGSSGYGVIEADFLYCFINHKRPKKVIQIGCGVSTSIILRASKKSETEVKVVCIDPYPSNYLKKLNIEGKIQLIDKKAQIVDLVDLVDLDAGDLLFIDSTHTVKVGSEVNRIILEVLPRLKKGVLIHFHDVFFPYDYQRDINSTPFFWSESSLLHSFLINNDKFVVRAAQSILHYEAKDFLKETFPNYNPQFENYGIPITLSEETHFPSSIYLEVI